MSADFQTVLSRAVSIASVPLNALQNRETDALQKKAQLGAMSSPLADVGAAIATLGKIASSQAVSVSSSNYAKVSVTNSGATTPATYSITNIMSVASAASEVTATHYEDPANSPVASNGAIRLVVGSKEYNFTPSSNDLNAIRDKINSLGAGVSATVLTADAGSYLSLSSQTTGQTTLQLIDDPEGAATNLMTSANQGTNAQFDLNGLTITRPSNTVTDALPGVSLTVAAKTATDEAITVTVATDRSQLSSAIQDFVTKYNTVVDQVNGQVGASAGLLSGDTLVREISIDLRSVAGYQASGTVKSLAEMGVSFSTTGKMSFDATKFSALSDSQVSGAFSFFGSTTSGFGALAKKFEQLSDPLGGLVKLQLDGYDRTDKRLQTQIATMTMRINDMQKSLSAKLQMADALLAGIESQQKTISATLTSLNYVLYGKPAS